MHKFITASAHHIVSENLSCPHLETLGFRGRGSQGRFLPYKGWIRLAVETVSLDVSCRCFVP
jgi:hypothetical protein